MTFAIEFYIFSEKTTFFKQGTLFSIFSKMTLDYSVLNFLGKDNIVQTKQSIPKFSQK